MKVKIYIFFFVSIFQYFNISAQSFVFYGDRAYGGSINEIYNKIANLGNNQFALYGNSSSNISGDKTEPLCDSVPNYPPDIWLLKIDTGFNIIYDKDIGGNKTEVLPFLMMTSTNKQLIAVCNSYSDISCEKTEPNISSNGLEDYWVFMIDSNGNKLWDKTLGGTFGDLYPQIIELSTGEFIVCGFSNSPIGGDKTVVNYGNSDYWAVKLSASGQIIWDKVYGGSGREGSATGNGHGTSLLATENGGFIICGTTNSPASGLISGTPRGLDDIWIIKIDSAGTKIWDNRFGGSHLDYCDRIIHTDDGGYIIVGTTLSQQGFDVSQPTRGVTDVWVIKLDGLGNKQWDKRYGGNLGEEGHWIDQAPGGGYWVSSVTNSNIGFEVSEAGYGGGDYWILKIDSVGNKLWDKRFGGPGGDNGSNFVIMPDTSIYLFGYADSGTSAVKTDAGRGLADYWLVHFKYGYTFTGVGELGAGSGQLLLSPNPAKDNVELTIKNAELKNATLTLYDITGRVLVQQPFNVKANLDISGWCRGVYIVEVRDKEGRSVKGKLVKE